MPNWITNKIAAHADVIAGMLNSEGRIDFNVMAPFPGPTPIGDVWGDAESAAGGVLQIPLSDHPLIASLEAENRRTIDVKKMNDASFECFVGMLRNYRACGFLHEMDFARKVWGTKWNACKPEHDVSAGTASFDTAWSCPEGVLLKLSERFPSHEIRVEYADEDVGSNAGEMVLKAGKVVTSNIAPPWRDQTDEQKAFWKAFAYRVKGWDPRDYEDDAE